MEVLQQKNKRKPSKRKKKIVHRRKEILRVTYLYDEALPTELLFRGILDDMHVKTHRPSVQVKKQPLFSPYVIDLHPAVKEISEPVVRINLLYKETISPAVSLRQKELSLEDLHLSPQDTSDQIL